MDFQTMLQVIERYGVMPDRAPSLTPIQGALKDMGLYEFMRPERTVVIAGTNGKGTTTATLTHLLRSAGQRVGMYTSPHLVSITERIQSNGRNITPEEMLLLYEKVQPTMERWRLSHFEVLTLMMAEFFYRSGPALDWYIIEVGMGGSFDATNAIHHQFCVITTLGMDHEKFLGPGLSNIARNKFGIIHPPGSNSPKGCDVIFSPLPLEAMEPKREVSERTQARWYPAPPVQSERFPAKAQGQEPEFFINSPWGRAQLSLAGPRAAVNTATALKTFEVLGYDPSEYLSALKTVHWEGRMNLKKIRDRAVYFSGDHNPQGMQSLVDLLSDYRWKKLYLVLGVGI
ncbi:MAG: hypothetical protein K2X47_18075, partial [Bdellovibrionales bacterium]|nr:hypothetical protein [Bdellovibrionales bacterium]